MVQVQAAEVSKSYHSELIMFFNSVLTKIFYAVVSTFRACPFWKRQRILYAPAKNPNSSVNYAVRKSELLVPVALVHCDSIKSKFFQPNPRSIIGLLFLRGPSDISRLVITIVINPIKAMIFAWGNSDMLKKSKEIVSPFFAHNYAATAISMEKLIFRVKTSFLSMLPSRVFFGFFVAHKVIIGQIFQEVNT